MEKNIFQLTGKTIFLYLFVVLVIYIFPSCAKNNTGQTTAISDFKNGMQYYNKNENEKASMLLSSAILKRLPNKMDILAHGIRGSIYLSIHSYNYAEKDLTYAIENKNTIEPDAILECYGKRAQVYIKSLEFDKAEDDLLSATKINKDDGIIYLLKGDLDRERGNFSSAMANYDLASKLLSDKTHVYLDKELILEITGKYNEAIKEFDKAKSNGKSHQGFNCYIARVLYMQGRLKEALKYIQKDEEKNTNPFERILINELKINIFDELQYKKEFNNTIIEAEKYLSARIMQDPQIIDNYISLATVYCKAKMKLNKALDIAKKAVEIGPSKPVYNILATCYYENNDLKNAEKYMLKYLEIKPTDISGLRRLGYIYKAEGNIKKAKEMWGEILKINPNYRFILKELKKN
jgi:tetratricopeptide (TPR) repeat protein